jgi:hypothetical protein
MTIALIQRASRPPLTYLDETMKPRTKTLKDKINQRYGGMEKFEL